MCLSTYFIQVATVIYGDFEWDEEKAVPNLAKHGVAFEEATTAVVDPNAVFLSNDADAEGRLMAIGMSQRLNALLVVFVERGTRDRLISARYATREEEILYEQGN